jgi:hypothetical protein
MDMDNLELLPHADVDIRSPSTTTEHPVRMGDQPNSLVGVSPTWTQVPEDMPCPSQVKLSAARDKEPPPISRNCRSTTEKYEHHKHITLNYL